MIPSMAAFLLHCTMILNGIFLFDEPSPELLTPAIKLEIVNIINIVKNKKVDIKNHHEFIGYVSDRELVHVDPEICGGYYSLSENKIALDKDSIYPLATLCHELGHYVQDRLGLFDLTKPFSYQVKLEHQAETIAYNLYSALVDKNIDHKKFNCYFDIDSIEWLDSYYSGYYDQDLLH